MANELVLSAQSGTTNYCVIRDDSNDVWDVISNQFVMWNDDDLDNYVISLTDRSGDLFTADFPANISIGQYTIIYYKYTGSETINDTILTSETINWTGSDDTSVSITLDPFALVDLATVKQIINIHDDDITKDAVLTTLINAATYKIEKYCSRQFVARNYIETLNVNSQTQFVMNSPIINIEKIGFGRQTGFRVTNPSALRATVTITNNSVILKTTSSTGATSTNTLLFSIYRTTAQIVTGINSVSGYIATLEENAPSDELWPNSGKNVTKQNVEFDIIDIDSYDYDYTINENIGAIAFTGLRTNEVRVWYRAGFDPIPADLAMICAEIVRILYHMINKDPSVTSIIDGRIDESATNRAFSELQNTQIELLDSYRFVDVAATLPQPREDWIAF